MSISSKLQGVPIKKVFLGYGENAILNTVDEIKRVIRESAYNPYVRRWAEQIVEEVKPNDKYGEARAVYDFITTHVRYTKDPKGMEFIQTPPLLLQMIEQGEIPKGDCDDIATLAMSLLKSIGFDVGLKITSYNAKEHSNIFTVSSK